MGLFRETMGNTWAEICLDFLTNEENRAEAEELLYKMFSFDEEEARKNRDSAYRRLKEMKEDKIIECIDKGYYMMFGGVRE